ncbi:MAG: hypothetical protein AAGA59_00430 [Actinomycetota bacterium]
MAGRQQTVDRGDLAWKAFAMLAALAVVYTVATDERMFSPALDLVIRLFGGVFLLVVVYSYVSSLRSAPRYEADIDEV